MHRWVVVSVLALFVAFLLLKSRVNLRFHDPKVAAGRKRIQAAKQRARASKGDRAAVAQAWREAALAALEDLALPNLAASYARRADRIAPEDPASIRVAARAMARANRYPALEKLLWSRLAEADPGTERYEVTFEELLTLYEGPMRRRAQALALRRMRTAARPSTPAG